MLYLLLAILAVAAIAAVVMGDAGTLLGMDAATFVPVASGVVLAVYLMSSLAARGGAGGMLRAVKDMLVWVAIAGALVVAYSYRDQVASVGQRVMSELVPPGDVVAVDGPQGERSVRIRRRGDGHFIAKAQINGQIVPMLVDTGATSIVLKPADARAAGIDIDRLSFTVPVQTANGPAFAAAVRLRQIALGSIIVEGLDALVARPGVLQESLLGMNFLRRLRSYEFSGDFLTLRS